MKQKKIVRRRGGKTHGWGSMKKHRGAGNRGGRGNAGSGKRADQKKPMYWNDKKPVGSKKYGKSYFGKHGFNSIHEFDLQKINVQDLDARLPGFVAEKLAQKTGDTYTIDLKTLGIGKLLGTGTITKKVKVTVDAASAGAIEKVTAAGGSVSIKAAAPEVPASVASKK